VDKQTVEVPDPFHLLPLPVGQKEKTPKAHKQTVESDAVFHPPSLAVEFRKVDTQTVASVGRSHPPPLGVGTRKANKQTVGEAVELPFQFPGERHLALSGLLASLVQAQERCLLLSPSSLPSQPVLPWPAAPLFLRRGAGWDKQTVESPVVFHPASLVVEFRKADTQTVAAVAAFHPLPLGAGHTEETRKANK
jgi:hypothetical protein